MASRSNVVKTGVGSFSFYSLGHLDDHTQNWARKKFYQTLFCFGNSVLVAVPFAAKQMRSDLRIFLLFLFGVGLATSGGFGWSTCPKSTLSITDIDKELRHQSLKALIEKYRRSIAENDLVKTLNSWMRNYLEKHFVMFMDILSKDLPDEGKLNGHLTLKELLGFEVSEDNSKLFRGNYFKYLLHPENWGGSYPLGRCTYSGIVSRNKGWAKR